MDFFSWHLPLFESHASHLQCKHSVLTMPLVAVATLECHCPQWCFNAKKHGSLQSLHGSSFSEMGGGDIVKQMSDQTGQLLGGPPRKDLKDEKIFSDEQSEGMEKLQQMDRDKVKRMEKREEELKEMVEKEKKSVEDYESRKSFKKRCCVTTWRFHRREHIGLCFSHFSLPNESVNQRINESINQ